MLDAGRKPDDREAAVDAARGLDLANLDEKALKTPAVGDAASIVSAFPDVRTVLVAVQRGFAATPPGAVLDGRDIGTVICPGADVKIFVTATPEVRAARRAREFESMGEGIDEAAVLSDILKRDERDTKTRHFAAKTGRRRPLARHHQYGYIERNSGRHRHRRGHPSGPEGAADRPSLLEDKALLEPRCRQSDEPIVPNARY